MRPAERLAVMEYCKVQDILSGQIRVERGPQLLFLNPYEDIIERGTGVSLSKDSSTYLIVEDTLSGRKYSQKGPCVFFPDTHETVLETCEAIALNEKQGVLVQDALSGQAWVDRGPKLLFLEPQHSIVQRMDAITLQAFQYVRIVDHSTGAVRVQRGEALVFLEANEALEGGVQNAIEIHATQAALIKDRSTGVQRLETEPQLFFPKASEQVLEARRLVTLEEHEACVVRDAEGKFTFHGCNSDGPAAFFLPPHCELLQLNWSRGRRRERRDLYITKVDCRPQYMSFEFNCRTADNVELVLEGTFFWQVTNLPAMVANTGDTTGDICSHARSRFIALISRETLKDFMGDFNTIASAACQDDEFYQKRGVAIHTLEVTGYRCAENSTAQILQKIIQETTNRMNRLSQQESENEVNMFKLKGEIEQSRLKQELHDSEASVAGAAEAQKVRSFMAGIEEAVPELEQRLAMWQTLRKGDALATVSQGEASLYFTPADCNLSIEQHK